MFSYVYKYFKWKEKKENYPMFFPVGVLFFLEVVAVQASTLIMVRYNIIWNESKSIPDTQAVQRKPSKCQTEGSFLRNKEIIYSYRSPLCNSLTFTVADYD